MNHECLNIYRICRKNAGLTREKASELLSVSSRSLANYEVYHIELGKYLPPDDVVLKMAEVYKAPYLPLQHIVQNTVVGRSILPGFELMDLPRAFLKFQSEMADIQPIESEMRRVILDDVIEEHEEKTSELFIKEVLETIFSGFGLIFSAIEKRPLQEQRSLKNINFLGR